MTDVVGSTPMWERAPEVVDVSLQRHDDRIFEIIEAHGGFVLQHRGEGDSTFNVFQSTVSAVAAAIEIHRRLVDEPWPVETPIAVRIGVHCGEALFRDGDYHGR